MMEMDPLITENSAEFLKIREREWTQRITIKVLILWNWVAKQLWKNSILGIRMNSKRMQQLLNLLQEKVRKKTNFKEQLTIVRNM